MAKHRQIQQENPRLTFQRFKRWKTKKDCRCFTTNGLPKDGCGRCKGLGVLRPYSKAGTIVADEIETVETAHISDFGDGDMDTIATKHIAVHADCSVAPLDLLVDSDGRRWKVLQIKRKETKNDTRVHVSCRSLATYEPLAKVKL